jgi:hypothetical protein
MLARRHFLGFAGGTAAAIMLPAAARPRGGKARAA